MGNHDKQPLSDSRLIVVDKLDGLPLDWLVSCYHQPREKHLSASYFKQYHPRKYTSDWVYAGPLIFEEHISLTNFAAMPEVWSALIFTPDSEDGSVSVNAQAETPWLAAARCFAKRHVGKLASIPSILL